MIKVPENYKICALCQYWQDKGCNHIQQYSDTIWSVDEKATAKCGYHPGKITKANLSCSKFQSKVLDGNRIAQNSFIGKINDAKKKIVQSFIDDDEDGGDDDDGNSNGSGSDKNGSNDDNNSSIIDKILGKTLKLLFSPKTIFTILLVAVCAYSMYLATDSFIGALISGGLCFIVLKASKRKLIKFLIILFLATSVFTFKLATELYNVAVDSTKKFNVELIYEVGDVENIKVKSNQTVIFPNKPKEGYSLIGWYLDYQFTQEWMPTDLVKENISLYAQWQINTYKVSFVTNNETIISEISKEYNQPFSIPSIGEKTGYTFDGWYEDASLTKKFISNIIPGRDLVLYAKWNAKSFIVTYNTNGGTITNSTQTIHYNENYNLLIPTKLGYSFLGWKQDNNSFSSNEVWNLLENITLEATWVKEEYTISYILNNGINNLNNPISYNIDTNNITLLAPTRTGYAFNGWILNSETFANIGTWTELNGITLEATWTRQQYSIAYYLNGGINNASNPANYNVDDNIGLLAPTKDGNTFDGWYTESTFKNIITTLNGETGNKILYAKWSITQCTVTFDSTGGSDVSSKTVNQNLTITKPTNPTKRGYVFDGWYVDTSFTTPWDFANDKVRNNITLYAKWSDFTYTINNNEVTITGLVQYSTIKNLVIPNQINGIPVVYIGSNAFKDNSVIETVSIPDSVLSIGNSAFNGTISLSTVTIGNGVKTIGTYAFNNSNVTAVTIGNSLEIIKERAFYNCINLMTINLPSTLHTLGEYAFRYCKNLLNIELPRGLQVIGEGAFTGCTGLTSIIIYKNVVSIGGNAFQSCTNLTIYCELSSAPSGWINTGQGSYWSAWDGNCPIIWGYKE